MDDAAEPGERPDQTTGGDDIVAELRDLLGGVPPQVIERADDARRPG